MDEIIRQYADRLQEIYDKRIAGDYTFYGVLSEFLETITESCDASHKIVKRHLDRRNGTGHQNR